MNEHHNTHSPTKKYNPQTPNLQQHTITQIRSVPQTTITMCRVCSTTDLKDDGCFTGWGARRAYKLPCGEICLSRVRIPGARKVSDELGREKHVDGGMARVMYADIMEKKKKDYGSSDMVLRPRDGEGKVIGKEK